MKPGRHEGERGQALIEFALTIPVVFMVLFGIIDFGRALYAYDLVTNAARLGTRYAIVHGTSCTPSPCTATSGDIQTYVQSMVTGIDASSVTVVATWPAATGCAGGTATPLCPVLVKVTYSFKFLLSFSLTVPMTSKSQMIISQ